MYKTTYQTDCLMLTKRNHKQW